MILKPEIQAYINQNLHADLTKLAFKSNPFAEVSWSEIINQMACKQKAKDKLPSWYNSTNIIYPTKISIEQTSSEITASFKSDLVVGQSLIDISGGFGVDCFYFSKKIENVAHCEINPELSAIVKHNFEQFKVLNVSSYAQDGLTVIEKLNQNWDWIYIDPSRRNDQKGKVFMLADCEPNVPKLLNQYFKFARNILIKTAPILDISAAASELRFVKNIHIVAVNNEVKELLWELEHGFEGDLTIKTANLNPLKNQYFEYKPQAIINFENYSEPKKYLFEPNSAVMKSGGFEAIAVQYKLYKLHKNSHLYTSDILIEFPGRVFEIMRKIDYSKIEMKMYLHKQKANITTRNFNETVAEIRKKWAIADGGNQYCFFTTDMNQNKIVLICTKVKGAI